MELSLPTPLLGGLSPQQFMRRHWQKKPLLVRQAMPGFEPLLSPAELFALARQEQVESRLIVQSTHGWQMKSGPFARLPARSKPGWSLLVQGVDLHHQLAHQLLQQFRFVPDARLDDLMISYASTGGGVGPHFDSYDVFLFQASGQRRWRFGAQKDLSLQSGVPLKILKNFEPTQDVVLQAGDMLYLPPRYAHDGVAQACTGKDGKPEACMTYSIGFRSPSQLELASALLQRLSDYSQDEASEDTDRLPRRFHDPAQEAVAHPAALPDALGEFARQALAHALRDPRALACALGEYLTEPKASVWFDAPQLSSEFDPQDSGVVLSARSRMLYDAQHVFLNGEGFIAKGADAVLMRRLADERQLSAVALRKASAGALDLLCDWHSAGWIDAL